MLSLECFRRSLISLFLFIGHSSFFSPFSPNPWARVLRLRSGCLRLSERVINVLGGNPGPYTLNGTNCFIVGTGKRRILIDTGEPLLGAEVQIKSLHKALDDHGIEGFDMILITHMHGDHFGGVARILKEFPGTNSGVSQLVFFDSFL